jgi:alpha-N-arabinofuranosidase
VKSYIFLIILMFLSGVCTSVTNADTLKGTVILRPSVITGEVNPYVFGNNILGHRSDNGPANVFSDYGAGIWDPVKKAVIPEVAELAKNAGIRALRFPGGCGTHLYDWKQGIGPDREEYRFGIAEFLSFCQMIGAEPVFTISFFTGTQNDAADLVEYLNSPNDGTNPNGGKDWAEERAMNGHPKPYRVRYFEIGNEVWHGDHRYTSEVGPSRYAKRYLGYYQAMKRVDPTILIGAVMDKDKWNRKTAGIIKDKIDFGILHTYPSAWMPKEKVETMVPDELFRQTLPNPYYIRGPQIRKLSQLLSKTAGKRVPVAVTEFNTGFRQEKPVPYRHSLGSALVNAEMFNVLMDPENNVIFANNWNFINEYWGMIANGFNGKSGLSKRYYKRPNYYVFKMFKDHFGPLLIGNTAKVPEYTSDGKVYSQVGINASKSSDGKKIYIMIVNRNINDDIELNIELDGFIPNKEVSAWVLNGPGVDATNETDHDNVKIDPEKFDFGEKPYIVTVEPHSLTAVEITKAP